MQQFEEQKELLFQYLGEAQKMVLSTSLHDKVTSRIMSIVVLSEKFYFQTDIMMRKYDQIRKNPNVSLCVENIQVEGRCSEIGYPKNHACIYEVYKKNFPSAYKRYTLLNSTRVFEVNPLYIQKWIYENDVPFVEKYDFCKMTYRKEQYIGE